MLKLKLHPTMGGDVYRSEEGHDFKFEGNAPVIIENLTVLCVRGTTTLGGHGGSWDVEEHKWVDTKTGDNLRKQFKKGFTVTDAESLKRFVKI